MCWGHYVVGVLLLLKKASVKNIEFVIFLHPITVKITARTTGISIPHAKSVHQTCIKTVIDVTSMTITYLISLFC